MNSSGLKLDLGNLAWAPVNNFGSVEQLDRFNGIPTMGVFSCGDSWHLFWRAYHIGSASLWLYVPVSKREHDRIASGRLDPTDGVLFQRRSAGYATFGAAFRNRLVFEREIQLDAGQSAEEAQHQLLEHVQEALEVALALNLPRERREKVEEVKRELDLV